jgi:hypothetical protein
MKKNYKREAWLADDGILISGYTTKHKFFPNSFGCGFSYQKVHKRDIGKILFYNKTQALDTGFIIG